MSAKAIEHNEQARGLTALRQRLAAHPLMRADRLPSIGKELAFAVADIRQKLIEEAAYGRTVTPDTIHGRQLDAAGDPLGRSGAGDHLRERCRHAYDTRQQHTPERSHEPNR